MNKKPLLILSTIILSLSLSIISCKKEDLFQSFRNSVDGRSGDQEAFFTNNRSSGTRESAIVDYLKRKNLRSSFVAETIKRIGYPHWKNSRTVSPKDYNQFGPGESDSSEITYIPFARESERRVNAVMVFKTNGTDTTIGYACDWQYKQLNNDPDLATDAAENYAMDFMLMDQQVFGNTKFIITDTSLFRHQGKVAHTVDLKGDTSGQSSLLATGGTYCDLIILVIFVSDGNVSSQIGLCFTYDTEVPFGGIGSGDSGSSGSPADPGSGGGGSGSGGGDTPPTCDPEVIGRNNIADTCEPGWEPVILELDPPAIYSTDYQMTQHEQAVFDQLDNEDNLADQTHQNQDCKGTKRTGNVFFQGTKEHWMIQLDFVSKNPNSGDVEYAIPFSSPAGNRGYADMVALDTKTIFEIKPNNLAGQSNGELEVENYVQKANTYCNMAQPISLQWSKGTNYVPTFLPTGKPNEYLKSNLYAPGVVVYEKITISNPLPAPTLVPVSIVSKFKHLIGRLRQNFDQADRIIAEYLQQNPDLASYIKSAAIGAGIAIIVSTILEDIITAGVGIADDWACFTLAYRIIRFGLAI